MPDLEEIFGLDPEKTIVKLGEVEDERIDEIVKGEHGLKFGMARVRAKRSLPHLHRRTRETYYGISGVTTVEVDGVLHELEVGDVLQIKRDQMHFIPYATRDAEFLVMTDPPHDPADHHEVDRAEHLYTVLLMEFGRVEGLVVEAYRGREAWELSIFDREPTAVRKASEVYDKRIPRDLRDRIKLTVIEARPVKFGSATVPTVFTRE